MATAPMRISPPLNNTSPPTTLMASVTFFMTSRTVSRISWKSMTDTLGNRTTRSCWKRARPEDEHKAAVPGVAPFDVAHARHARGDDGAQDVEAHGVAHVDAGSLV